MEIELHNQFKIMKINFALILPVLAGKATRAMQRCIEGRCAASWPVKYFLACLLVGGHLFSQ